MKVYVVICEIGYESVDVEEVFSTRKKAHDYIQSRVDSIYYDYYELEVDSYKEDVNEENNKD